MKHHEKEIIHRMVYHKVYAVRMEQVLIDPDHPRGILVRVFDLDRIDDIREAIDRGYLDYAASYGVLYRMVQVAKGRANTLADSGPKRIRTLVVEAGSHAVEMEIEFSQPGSPWGAGIRPDDSERSHAAYQALKRGDLETAAQYGKVYRLEPVEVEPAAEPWRPTERLPQPNHLPD